MVSVNYQTLECYKGEQVRHTTLIAQENCNYTITVRIVGQSWGRKWVCKLLWMSTTDILVWLSLTEAKSSTFTLRMQRFLTPPHPNSQTPQAKEELVCVETETGRVCPPLCSSSSSMCEGKEVYWDSLTSSLYQYTQDIYTRDTQILVCYSLAGVCCKRTPKT